MSLFGRARRRRHHSLGKFHPETAQSTPDGAPGTHGGEHCRVITFKRAKRGGPVLPRALWREEVVRCDDRHTFKSKKFADAQRRRFAKQCKTAQGKLIPCGSGHKRSAYTTVKRKLTKKGR
jgi:hypothetical protein